MGRLTVARLEWDSSAVLGEFDVVLAADCLYVVDTVPALFGAATRHAKRHSLDKKTEAVGEHPELVGSTIGDPRFRLIIAHYPRGWDDAANDRILAAVDSAAVEHYLIGETVPMATEESSEARGRLLCFAPDPTPTHRAPRHAPGQPLA